MKPDIIAVVAHGGGQAVFDRCTKYWESHGLPIVVVTSTRDPVRSSKQTLIIPGHGFRAGTDSNVPTMVYWDLLLQIPRWNMLAIFEYDSICIAPDLGEYEPGFTGNFFAGEFDPSVRTITAYSAHVPIMVDRQTLATLKRCYDDGRCDHSLWGDMLVASMLLSCNPPVHAHKKRAWTACGGELKLGDERELRARMKDGLIMIHGIKHVEALNMIERILCQR